MLAGLALALIAPAPVGASSRRQTMVPAQAVPLPRLIGLKVDSALRLLGNLHFRGRSHRVASAQPSGEVIDQAPRPETQVRPGIVVDLTVSSGPAPSHDDVRGDRDPGLDSTTVPNLVGQTHLGAGILLVLAKLSFGKTQSVPDEANDGKVVRQFPEAGVRLPRSAFVDLWLGKAAPVVVPELRDSTVAGAAEVLLAVGLKLGRVDSNFVEAGTRRIVRQQPGVQKNASRGSAVRVWYEYPSKPPPEPQRVPVPSVVGNTLARANDILLAAELAPGPVASVETELPPGHVLSQNPKAGDSVPRNTRVALQVAVQSRFVKVPELTDNTPAAARSALERVGLHLGAVTPAPLQGGTGRVISQAPLAGATVLRGTDVSVRISVPPPPVTVPNVVGSRLSLARETVLDVGLAVGTVTPGTPTNADSTVAAQSPGAGAVVPSRTAVDLTLATEKGQPPTRRVPNVVRRGRFEADSLLRAAGFRTGTITPVQSTNVGRDTVISQSPAAGTPAPPGSAVSLQVAAPPPPQPQDTVPNVVGLSTAAAESILLTARLGAERASEPSGPSQRGLVLRQDPPAGAVAPAGTIVRLTIGDWPPVWLIVVIVAGSLVGIGAGAAAVKAWRPHRIDQQWQKRVTLEAESGSGKQALPDDTEPLGGPELTLGANPGEGSQEVAGDGPSIGESPT